MQKLKLIYAKSCVYRKNLISHKDVYRYCMWRVYDDLTDRYVLQLYWISEINKAVMFVCVLCYVKKQQQPVSHTISHL